MAALATMLMISGIIVEIAIAGTLLSFVFIRSGLSSRLTAEASIVARAGIQDALLRLARDKDLSTQYVLTVGSYSTTVGVTRDNDCTTGFTGRTCITSSSVALTSKKKFQAITAVDVTTGEVRVISIYEVVF